MIGYKVVLEKDNKLLSSSVKSPFLQVVYTPHEWVSSPYGPLWVYDKIDTMAYPTKERGNAQVWQVEYEPADIAVPTVTPDVLWDWGFTTVADVVEFWESPEAFEDKFRRGWVMKFNRHDAYERKNVVLAKRLRPISWVYRTAV